MDGKEFTPLELERELGKNIVGQNEYIHDLALTLWLHNQRRLHYIRTGEKHNHQ